MDAKRPFGSKRPPVGERRRSKRNALGISVALHSTTQSRVVCMLDVSQSGARVSGPDLPKPGKDVLLKIADVELFGSIVRGNDKEAAIAFDRPIPSIDVHRLQAVLEEQTREAMLHLR